jgi:hypothetical protein
MNIIKTLDQYNEHCVHFCESIKNNVMNEGQFIRILYSTQLMSLNGIYVSFTLNDLNIEKYYNKYKLSFKVMNHIETIDNITQIENGLLKKINIKNKIPQYKIKEQFLNGNIKMFIDSFPKQHNNMSFLLKISGIWETNSHYGVTFKFSKL